MATGRARTTTRSALTAFARGSLSDSDGDGVPDTVSTASRSQSWTLDGLGNWSTLTTGSVTQHREHNRQNQLTAIDGVPLVYDNNGDLIQNDTGRMYVYDAWNRLVQVNAPGVTVHYAYDALGQRDQETRTGGVSPGTRQYYYSDDWQILEERDGLGAVLAQNVWSPVYVDALVERDQGRSASTCSRTPIIMSRRSRISTATC